MAKIIPLHYNGELGYKKTIQEVYEFFKFRNWTVEDFLNFENPQTKLKNRDLIWDSYDVRTLISYGLANEDGELNPDTKNSGEVVPAAPCPVPITFYIDSKYLEKSILVTQSNVLVNNFSVESFTYRPDNDKAAFVAPSNEFYNYLLNGFLRSNDNSNKDKLTSLLGEQLQYKGGLSSNRFRDGKLGAKSVKTGQIDENGDDMINTFPQSREYSKNRIVPHVYVWCKSLNDGVFSESSVFDLSPFILSMNMTVAQTGGNFSIQLAPIEGLINCGVNGEPEGIWNVARNQYVNFTPTGSSPNIVEQEHYFKTLITKVYEVWLTNLNIYGAENDYGKRFQNQLLNNLNSEDITTFSMGIRQWTRMFFEYVISSNDIVFLSYGDPFDKSERSSLDRCDDFFISHNSLVNGEYDMIGLIDTNSITHTPENEDITITITGRDCMKLLIEDGSYFFAKSFANPDETESAFNNVDIPNQGDSNNAFNNAVSNPGAVNRLITTGILDMLFIPEARNVDFVMNLIMSRLANIEICPSQLFEAWGERRTKFLIVTEEQVDESKPSARIDETSGD
jgi:hypothetical protein